MTIEDEYRAAEALISAGDGWLDEPERDWSTLTMFLLVLAFMIGGFCMGVLIGLTWILP